MSALSPTVRKNFIIFEARWWWLEFHLASETSYRVRCCAHKDVLRCALQSSHRLLHPMIWNQMEHERNAFYSRENPSECKHSSRWEIEESCAPQLNYVEALKLPNGESGVDYTSLVWFQRTRGLWFRSCSYSSGFPFMPLSAVSQFACRLGGERKDNVLIVQGCFEREKEITWKRNAERHGM